jgi:hypothetical protein
MSREMRYFDDDNWQVQRDEEWAYVEFTCDCKFEHVTRYRRDRHEPVCPECGASYNGSGQRLRDGWRDNPSNYDENIGDLEGFEIAQLRKESEA